MASSQKLHDFLAFLNIQYFKHFFRRFLKLTRNYQSPSLKLSTPFFTLLSPLYYFYFFLPWLPPPPPHLTYKPMNRKWLRQRKAKYVYFLLTMCSLQWLMLSLLIPELTPSHLQKKTSAPIRAWNSYFPPFQKIMTDHFICNLYLSINAFDFLCQVM